MKPPLKAIALCLLAGCGDMDRTAKRSAGKEASADIVTGPAPFFSADVTISYSGGPDLMANAPSAFHQSTFHLLRTWTGSAWTMHMTFPSPPNFAGASAPSADLASLDTDDLGSFLNLYDRNGAIIPSPVLPALPYASPTPPALDPPSGTRANPLSGNRGAWLANMMVTATSTAATMNRLSAYSAADTVTVTPLVRYSTVSAGTTYEMLYDPSIGALSQLNVSQGGALLSHVTYGYSTLSTGAVMRTSMTFQRAVAGSATPLTSTFALSNVQIGGSL